MSVLGHSPSGHEIKLSDPFLYPDQHTNAERAQVIAHVEAKFEAIERERRVRIKDRNAEAEIRRDMQAEIDDLRARIEILEQQGSKT